MTTERILGRCILVIYIAAAACGFSGYAYSGYGYWFAGYWGAGESFLAAGVG